MSAMYAKQFNEAFDLLKEGTFEDCIRISRRNLCDPTLPAYWTIKNLINIAHATDDWGEAEICLGQCKQIYLVSKMRCEDRVDKVEGDKEGLEELKRAIDELERFQQEDRRNMRSDEVMVPDETEQEMLFNAVKEKAASLRHRLKKEEDLSTHLGDLKIEHGGDEEDQQAQQKDDRGFLGEEYELYTTHPDFKVRCEALERAVKHQEEQIERMSRPSTKE